MRYALDALVEVSRLEPMMDRFRELTGMAIAVHRLDGTHLIGSRDNDLLVEVSGGVEPPANDVLRVRHGVGGLATTVGSLVLGGETVAWIRCGPFLTQTPVVEAVAAASGLGIPACRTALDALPLFEGPHRERVLGYVASAVDFIGAMAAARLEHLEVVEELRESRHRLELALSAGDIGCWTWDVRTGVCATDERWSRMLGYEPRELSADLASFERLLHPEDHARDIEARSRILDGAGVTEGVYRLRHKNGGWVHIRSRANVAQRDAEGRPVRVAGTHMDVTQQVRVETARREQERLLQLLVTNAPVDLFTLDPHGVVTSSRGKTQTLRGLSSVEVVGTSMFDHFGDSPAVVVSTLRALTGESFSALEGVGGRAYETHYSPIHDEDGRLEGAVGVAFDVTERNRMMEALRRSEARFRTIVESHPDGVVVLDLSGRIRDSNPAFSALVGRSRSELVSLGWPDLTPVSWRDADRDANEIVLRRGVARYEKELERADGSVFPVSATAWLLRNGDGSPDAVLVVVQDLTSRRLEEERSRTMEAQLVQFQRLEAIGKLAGGVAHDLNNMLTPVLGHGALLLEDLPPDDPRHQSAESILQAARRCRDLVRQLLAFARRQTLEMRPLDLHRVVGGFVRMLRSTLREDVKITTRFEARTPTLRGDVGQIEQIILNLAVNAQDAMPDGGELTIETADVEVDQGFVDGHQGTRPGRYLLLCVRDTGSGIDPDTLGHVFEPFFTTKAAGKGTGLGLSTVYGSVKQHGGSVWIESVRGVGTQVRVYFPALGGNEAQPEAGEEGGEPGGGPETILVVEDQAEVRELVTDSLRSRGYTVHSAGDGREAIEVARSLPGRPDLILTDVVLPDTNGREIAHRVSELHPGLAVLYMSGYSEDVISHRGALEAGTELLQKPFTPQALAARVRVVLDRNHRAPAALS